MENKIAYLEMIENAIERMSSNSFQLKGWSVTLVGVIGALSANGSDKRFLVLAFIPLIAFYFLDSYYLQMERKYTELYKGATLINDDDKVSFSMDIHAMVLGVEAQKRVTYLRCLLSASEVIFYIGVTLSVVFIAIMLISY